MAILLEWPFYSNVKLKMCVCMYNFFFGCVKYSYKNHDSMHISISKGPLKYGVYNSSKITGPQTTLYSLRCSGPGFREVITKKIVPGLQVVTVCYHLTVLLPLGYLAQFFFVMTPRKPDPEPRKEYKVLWGPVILKRSYTPYLSGCSRFTPIFPW